MTTAIETTTLTEIRPARAEDFAEREIARRRLEIWKGEPIETAPAGKDHNKIAMRFYSILEAFCANRPDLECCGDNDGFVVAEDPETFLCPDAALFRVREAGADDGPWHRFAPEIAVEVASPDNTRPEILAKRDLYLAGGTEQVWLADPKVKRLEIHFADGRALAAEGGGKVAMSGLAAGLTLDLDRIFAPPRSR